MERKHVVIIGGGFAGLQVARKLRRAPVRITLVDRRNHHLFQPLLYQVATAALNPSDIASPIRSILRRNANTRVILGEAMAVHAASKELELDGGERLSYDMLVVATGATHSYFGHDEWAANAPGLKTIEDALEIRKRVFLAFEEAERETDPDVRRQWLTFVIVGGGPTGVELAGALGEIARRTLVSDFRSIDPSETTVHLVEGLDRVLPTYTPDLSASARQQLERIGVNVRTGQRVTAMDEGGVVIDGVRLPARTVLWAAGVQASPLARSLGAPLDRAGRVLVTPDLSVPGQPDVFVIGDLAAVPDLDGGYVPGVAPAALQEGAYVARAIARRAAGGKTGESFHYVDKGSFAVIGRGKAVGDMYGRVKVRGFFAWLAWLVIHIAFLIGFRNRFFVILQWAYSYLTHKRGARLITGVGALPKHALRAAPAPIAALPAPARGEADCHAPGASATQKPTGTQ